MMYSCLVMQFFLPTLTKPRVILNVFGIAVMQFFYMYTYTEYTHCPFLKTHTYELKLRNINCQIGSFAIKSKSSR